MPIEVGSTSEVRTLAERIYTGLVLEAADLTPDDRWHLVGLIEEREVFVRLPPKLRAAFYALAQRIAGEE